LTDPVQRARCTAPHAQGERPPGDSRHATGLVALAHPLDEQLTALVHVPPQLLPVEPLKPSRPAYVQSRLDKLNDPAGARGRGAAAAPMRHGTARRIAR